MVFVEFVLISADVTAANRDTALLALGDDAGRNWMVRAVLPAGSPTNYDYVTARDGAEVFFDMQPC